MAWPRAPCAETSSSPRTTSSARLGRIQSPEVLEHEPPLLRREPRQLFPRRIAQPGPPARGAGLEQRGKVHTIAGGRATAAFLAFVGLAPGQGPAGVEQAAVQPLLALDRLLVETARVQRSEEHTSELQSRVDLVCRLLLEKKNFGSLAGAFFFGFGFGASSSASS